jgi:hypothetical protein
MAFTSAQRFSIKQWLGYGQLQNPELDAAITSIEAVGETQVSTWLTELDGIMTRIKALRSQAQVAGAGNGEATLDTIRGIFSLCAEGKMYVGFLADAMNVSPLRDVFTPHRLGRVGI